MWPSLRPSQREGIVAKIDPQNAAAGTINTLWIDGAQYVRFKAIVHVGAMAAGATVDANFQQALDNAGTGAKAVAGAAIVQVLAAGGGNLVVEVQIGAGSVDRNNNFRFVSLQVIVGTAAAYVAATVEGVDPHYGPADGLASTITAQTITA